MGLRLNRRLITHAATHWGARNLVQVSPAYVEPLKIIKVHSLARRFAAGSLAGPVRIEGNPERVTSPKTDAKNT